MAHLSNIEGIEMEGKLPEVRLASTPFKAVSPYEPAGDQPQAIEKLATGVKEGLRYQNLLGVTGSGKTFTMAKVIEAVQKPTLVMAPNKTLAAQLASELKEFFPDNAVVYFVSYYDYYQPEAYVPSSDTFIEKDASINEEVEKLRHAATSALLSRRDCIVVASVSCIYGIGSPMDYAGMAVFVDKQKDMDRDQVIHELIDIQYDRNDYEQKRGTFRVRGDALDVFPPYADHPIRIEFWGDEIESITEIDNVTGEVLSEFEALPIWPASHYVTARPKMDRALGTIRDELRERLQQFKEEGKLLEAQRLEMRVNYDLEMLETMNFCSGIENYSRHMDGREPGEPPYTLIDYFPKDFFCIIDESHVTVPQIRGMHEGDRSRKITLAEHGFRLPSCLDNRPLRFDEFEDRIPQDSRSVHGADDGAALLEAHYPGAIRELHLLRRRLRGHRQCELGLFRQSPQRARCRRMHAAGRHPERAERVRAVSEPWPRARAPAGSVAEARVLRLPRAGRSTAHSGKPARAGRMTRRPIDPLAPNTASERCTPCMQVL
jgi:excinuclease ABC subunit B